MTEFMDLNFTKGETNGQVHDVYVSKIILFTVLHSPVSNRREAPRPHKNINPNT